MNLHSSLSVEDDVNGNLHYKCALNTQVCLLFKFIYVNIHLPFSQTCEQLNSSSIGVGILMYVLHTFPSKWVSIIYKSALPVSTWTICLITCSKMLALN